MSAPGMATWGWVALGGAAGACGRFAVGLLAARLAGDQFPWGTLAVNLIGCFAIGVVLHAVHAEVVPAAMRPAVAIGLLGGLTTFSSFGYETWLLLQREAYGAALLNVLGNVLGGLLAAGGGLACARACWPISSPA